MTMIHRRFFLKSGGLAVVALGSGLLPLPRFLVRAATETRTRGTTLVVVFQRGAADGLNVVVPHGERAYYTLRPTIAIPPPRRAGEDRLLELDGFFGLHPALESFKRLYDEKLLAIVHAAGSPDATRSHFDAQDFMESGTPGLKSTRDGWLNRYLQSSPRADATAFRAVATTSQLPRILSGSASSLAIPDLERFGFGKHRAAGLAQQGLERLWAGSDDPLLAQTARESLDAVDYLQRVDPGRYRPENGARYPADDLGRNLQQVAQLIKAGVGLEVAFAETGGWDHHVNEGGASGQLANLLRRFSAGIDAFVRDLGARMQEVVLVTLSEFGRTAAENGSRGTDHGHANAIFVIGGPVAGGRVLGRWPGLEPEQLYEGRDLDLTTDYRDVMGAVLSRHLGARRLERVFPGHSIDGAGLEDLLRRRSGEGDQGARGEHQREDRP
jgi:uncharacterized protein (DUF1501 family)